MTPPNTALPLLERLCRLYCGASFWAPTDAHDVIVNSREADRHPTAPIPRSG